MSWISRCFEVSAFSICMCWESDRAHACTHGTWGSLNSPNRSFGVTHFPCSCESSLSLRGPLEDPTNLWFMYTSYLSCNRLDGERGPGLLSQQRTTHHFLLSSLLLGLITESKHSGSMILLVSQGRLFIQFSPTTLHCSKVFWCGVKKKESEE